MISLVLYVMAAAQAAAPVEAAPAPAPKAAKTKVVCKRFEDTGSLVRKRKVCHTRTEWSRLQQATQDEWGAIQGIVGNSRGD
jgi:hypothetical protein